MELKRRIKKDPVHYAGIIFHGRGRQYTFKTILDLKEGEKVIVKTANGITMAEVLNPIVDHNKEIEYNWVLGRVNFDEIEKDHYSKLVELGIDY